MPYLSLENRVTCTVLHQEGWTQKRIAERIGCSQNAVSLAIRRHQQTGSHQNRPKSGRPRVSCARDDRILIRDSMSNRRSTVPQLRVRWKQHGVNASDTTVRRRLSVNGIHARIPRKKPFLTQRHKDLRLNFAREHEDWTWVDWSVVLFSDESKINLYQHDGTSYVHRRAGEDMLPECITHTRKFGGGGVMVWGVMSYRGVGMLKTIRGTLNGTGYIDVLGDFLVPSAHMLGYADSYIFQEDNAPCHKARIVTEWKENAGITTLAWPPQSPDLSPIENLWSSVARDVREDNCANLQQLEACIHRKWDLVSPDTCSNLIRSMPRRIRAVIDARGGHTRF